MIEKTATLALAALVALTGSIQVANAAFAGKPHIAIVIDHSGSMNGKVQGFARLLASLERPVRDSQASYSPLNAAVYSLMSFEYNQDLLNDPDEPRSAEIIARELRKLRTGGGREDGYAALEAMLGQLYDETPSAIWLVTDEWRNAKATPSDFDGLLRLLSERNVILHAIVRADFTCDDGAPAFGITADRSGPAPVDRHGWTVCQRVEVAAAPARPKINGQDRTVEEYVDLALASGGSAWDLEALVRNVPAAADAFAQYQANALLQAASASTLQPAIQLVTPAVIYQPVVLDASTSAGAITRYTWDLDSDGVADATGPIITHQFSTPGNHRVVVQVETSDGASAWAHLFLTLDE